MLDSYWLLNNNQLLCNKQLQRFLKKEKKVFQDWCQCGAARTLFECLFLRSVILYEFELFRAWILARRLPVLCFKNLGLMAITLGKKKTVGIKTREEKT